MVFRWFAKLEKLLLRGLWRKKTKKKTRIFPGRFCLFGPNFNLISTEGLQKLFENFPNLGKIPSITCSQNASLWGSSSHRFEGGSSQGYHAVILPLRITMPVWCGCQHPLYSYQVKHSLYFPLWMFERGQSNV